VCPGDGTNMVVSHLHKYLFLEIPLTGSWAIRSELCELYGGVPILHKHATYPEFLSSATAAERRYFVFATVRNPLDKLVSRYYKLKTDHKGAFSDPKSTERLTVDFSDRRKYEFITDTGATFATFLREFGRRPYGSFLDISADYVDFVIRFERLQEGFSEVLRLLGLEQVRRVPLVNKTRGRETDWVSYYTPDIIERAKKTCGPFMERWDYEFPPGWGEYKVSWITRAQDRLVSVLRTAYLTRFRYSNKPYARIIRRLRARLIK
jgi:hypothetical protein